MDNGTDASKRKAAATAVMQRIDQRERRGLAENGDSEEATYEYTLLGPRKEDLILNQYEQTIAVEVVAPEDITIGFEGRAMNQHEESCPLTCTDIGGLENVIEELKEAVIYPLTMPNIYSQSSALLSAPSGVLLYGPPGCGKTMLAKALAKESNANFINLHISTLTEKWFGDSNKLVNAVFSLARKLQPTIVFIDEVDAVLGQRRSGEHEASAMVKAEFMTHWDGLASANVHGEQQRILILGATNRMQDIDEAILRRMPKKFPVNRPNTEQRERILRLLLKDTKIDKQNFDLAFLTKISSGMSGSDLKEACRDAAMVPVRECLRQKRTKGGRMGPVYPDEIRGLRTDDFFQTAGGSVLQGQLADAISKNVKTKSDKLGQRRISQVEELEEEEFLDPE